MRKLNGSNRMSDSAILKVNQATLRYDTLLVLDKVSFDLNAGQTLLILGHNGSGKTTLLSIIAGALTPEAGQVTVGNENIHTERAARSHVGYVTHESMLHPGLSVRESLEWFARAYGLDQPQARVEKLAGQLDMVSFLDRAASNLSRGQSQRAAIARAMIAEPGVLLLDEPFTGLDEKGQRQLKELITSLQNNSRAIILTTHQTELGLGCATNVACLESGSLSESVSTKDNSACSTLVDNFRKVQNVKA